MRSVRAAGAGAGVQGRARAIGPCPQQRRVRRRRGLLLQVTDILMNFTVYLLFILARINRDTYSDLFVLLVSSWKLKRIKI